LTLTAGRLQLAFALTLRAGEVAAL